MARELQAQFAQESKWRDAGSLAEDPHQGRAGDPGFRGKRVERPGPRGRHQHGCHGTGRRRRDQKLHEIIGTCRLIEMTPEHHDEKGAGEIPGNGRSPGPASLELFIDGRRHGRSRCLDGRDRVTVDEGKVAAPHASGGRVRDQRQLLVRASGFVHVTKSQGSIAERRECRPRRSGRQLRLS